VSDHTTSPRCRVIEDTGYASLCALGQQLVRQGLLATLADGCTIRQKTIRYSPAQKVQMLFCGLLTGITGICRMETIRAEPALQLAFGLPGCAEQSVLSDTLSAVTDADVAALRTACEGILRRSSTALAHDLAASILTLDLDLSPAPASKRCEGSVKSYQGKNRTAYGRKTIRVIARKQDGEVLWEDVIYGNRSECLALMKLAVAAIERLFGMAEVEVATDVVRTAAEDAADAAAAAKRSRIEWRLDSGWGIDELIIFLLDRGYHVTGKFHTHSRTQRLAKLATSWTPGLRAGSEYWVVPEAERVPFARPVQQVVARVPLEKARDGYRSSVFFSTRTELGPRALFAHYDDRAGMEAEIKGDKRGLGLASIRKHSLAAQRYVVLLIDLAHNVLTWARAWLARQRPRLGRFGIVRLVRDIWAIPGRVMIREGTIQRISLRRQAPHAAEVSPLITLLVRHDVPIFLGQT
jgi:hypothetical protein